MICFTKEWGHDITRISCKGSVFHILSSVKIISAKDKVRKTSIAAILEGMAAMVSN
uniref:Uncharacterized protein n=1 Tax=Arundo donax TaxID=35708 RepID=A0A0A9CMV6_ARUDO